MKKKILFASVLVTMILGFMSCSKDSSNELTVPSSPDAYVGTWNYSSVGSVKMTMLGQEVPVQDIKETGKYTVSKVGSDSIKIGNETNGYKTGKISGSTIVFKDETESVDMEGMPINQKTVTTAKINSASSIVITETFSGSADMITISGSNVTTLTK